MALPTEVQLFTVDDKGEAGVVTVRIPENTAITDARCFAQELADIVDDITGAYIFSIKITYSMDTDFSGMKYPASANSDTEAGALFIFESANGFKTQVRIPAFREDFLVSQSRNVDETHPEVSDFIAAMVDGLCGFVVAPVVNTGDDVDHLLNAKENFARSRQGRSG